MSDSQFGNNSAQGDCFEGDVLLKQGGMHSSESRLRTIVEVCTAGFRVYL
jgi:hypothetical protein